MENADRCDTVGRMMESYGPNGTVEMMNQNELTEELSSNLRANSAERTVPVQTTVAHSDRVETTKDRTSLGQTITAQNSTVYSISLNGNKFDSNSTINVCIGADSTHKDGHKQAKSQKLKSKIKEQYVTLFEGTPVKGDYSPLNDIYTELYIVKDWRGGVNTDHEMIQVEARSARHAAAGTAIRFSEVFSGSQHVKKVLTLGIAGIGKTVSVQKFALDWANGKSNKDIDFVFIIPFRRLNLLKKKEYSLPELLHHVYPEQPFLKEAGLFDGECKCVFIFDGLDEFRSPLTFGQKEISALTEKASVNVLVTSLITGALFPSACVWITSRPAAADQIPLNYIHLETEVQGFVTDQQKEEYFRKRISDQDQAKRIISHIKKSKTLYSMCYIPVFCWITYRVLQHNMQNRKSPEELKSLTQMYTHFLTILMETKSEKDNQTPQKDTKKMLESNRDMLLKLAELAFKQLMKGIVTFYEEDLRESSIDVTEASVYSGIFTGFFKEESEFQQRKVYCFVHLSFQEFLAAVYVFHCYEINNMEELQIFKPRHRERFEDVALYELLSGAVSKIVWSQNGQLDLFLRFLLGISLESNQRLLQGLLTPTQSSSEITRKYIKRLIKGDDVQISTERSINLFLCLSEMNDQSLSREIHEYLKSGKHSEENLSPGQCSALVYMILNSEEVLNELDPKKYSTSEEGYKRLIPAVTVCRKARLAGCNLTKDSCETFCSALQSVNSPLTELDLNNNPLQDSGVQVLSAGLKSSHCKLEILRLAGCNLTKDSCETLCSALHSANSPLTELDLSNNYLQESGMKLLYAGMNSSHCKLEILRLAGCNLTTDSCDTLCSALQLPNSPLKELDLNNNDLQDSGVQVLSAGLKSLHCKLEIIKLSGCMVTVNGCSFLASALKSNLSHLRELDLSYNHPGESGVKLLSDLLEDPHCTLDTLRVDHGGKIRMKPGLKKYAVHFTLDPNTMAYRLSLSEGNRKVENLWSEQPCPDHPDRFDGMAQVLSVESLTGRCYWEVQLSKDPRIGVSYRGIKRKGGGECGFGSNNQSWGLQWFDSRYSVYHNGQKTILPSPPTPSNRVGVYLDWESGTLSFYTISPNTHTLTHLHTLTTTFTEPLYAGFSFPYHSSVRLCEIE